MSEDTSRTGFDRNPPVKMFEQQIRFVDLINVREVALKHAIGLGGDHAELLDVALLFEEYLLTGRAAFAARFPQFAVNWLNGCGQDDGAQICQNKLEQVDRSSGLAGLVPAVDNGVGQDGGGVDEVGFGGRHTESPVGGVEVPTVDARGVADKAAPAAPGGNA